MPFLPDVRRQAREARARAQQEELELDDRGSTPPVVAVAMAVAIGPKTHQNHEVIPIGIAVILVATVVLWRVRGPRQGRCSRRA